MTDKLQRLECISINRGTVREADRKDTQQQADALNNSKRSSELTPENQDLDNEGEEQEYSSLSQAPHKHGEASAAVRSMLSRSDGSGTYSRAT